MHALENILNKLFRHGKN